MPQLNFKVKYKTGGELVVSAAELMDRYLFGVPMCTQNGAQLNLSDLELYILSAQNWIEQSLEIKLKKQIYHERCDFVLDQWKQWGYMKTTMPVRKVHRLQGMLNTVQQVEYPNEWCSVYMNENDQERAFRHVYIVPNGGTTPVNASSVIYLGISPHMGFFSMDFIPNYWDIWYCTGFDRIPENILNVLGKSAAIQVLNIVGDTLFTPGLNSQSLSFDGLSQSISTTVSNNVFKARITEYQSEVQAEMKQLREIYRGISFMAL